MVQVAARAIKHVRVGACWACHSILRLQQVGVAGILEGNDGVLARVRVHVAEQQEGAGGRVGGVAGQPAAGQGRSGVWGVISKPH